MNEFEYTVSQNGQNLGYLVIDSTVNNESSGGVRMCENVTIEELRALAYNMTLKYGFLKIPQGGAKAGIIFNPEAPLEQRLTVLSLFGKGISSFIKNRRYIPGPDMGVTSEDVQRLIEAAVRRKVRYSRFPRNSHYYTAVTVFLCAQKVAELIGINMSQTKVAIEGFGKVGSALACFFAESGARIVAISTSKGAVYNEKGLDVPHLLREYATKGSVFVLSYKEADLISQKDLLTLDVDMLSPCARCYTINNMNADKIKAKIISAGANIPVHPEVEKLLFSRSILCLPDFVTNCGGVLGTFLELTGLNPKMIPDFIRNLIGLKINEMINYSIKHNIPPRTYAAEIAMDNFSRIKKFVESKRGTLFKPSVVRFGRNLLPNWIMGRFAARYFKKALK